MIEEFDAVNTIQSLGLTATHVGPTAKPEVWEAVVDGRDVILKVNKAHLEPGRIAIEAWAYRQCAAAGIPAPEVLAAEGDVMVVERLRGGEAEVTQANLRLGGEVLRRLHTITASRFGWADSEHLLATGRLRGRDTDWCPMVRIALEDGIRGCIDAGYLDTAEGSRIERTLSDPDLMRPAGSHVLHGDFDCNHLFVEDGAVTGLIDFGDMHVGDPVWDIARYSLFHDERELGWLLDGYGPVDNLERVPGYRLAYAVVGTWWMVLADNRSVGDYVFAHRYGRPS